MMTMSAIAMVVLIPLLILAAAAVESAAAASAADSSAAPTATRHKRNRNLRARRRHLKKDVEFCGQCLWKGTIVCESRAQYLVKGDENGLMTLDEARDSILDDCISDGSEEVTLSLDAFCGECPYLAMNFNCHARVAYLGQNYGLSEEKAQESLLEKGQCIDPEYVAPTATTASEIQEENPGGTLSNEAIVGIVFTILVALVLCLLGLIARRRYFGNREKVQAEDDSKKHPTVSLDLIGDDCMYDDSEEYKHEPRVSIIKPNNRRNSYNRDGRHGHGGDRDKSRKSVSFAMDIKPDPSGDTSNIDPDDYYVVVATKNKATNIVTETPGDDDVLPEMEELMDAAINPKDGHDANKSSDDTPDNADTSKSAEKTQELKQDSAMTMQETELIIPIEQYIMEPAFIKPPQDEHDANESSDDTPDNSELSKSSEKTQELKQEPAMALQKTELIPMEESVESAIVKPSTDGHDANDSSDDTLDNSEPSNSAENQELKQEHAMTAEDNSHQITNQPSRDDLSEHDATKNTGVIV